MQAITTLHAQLCLATERLDLAQASLNAQDMERRNLKEESRSRLDEIGNLRRMLDEIKESERLAIEKLEGLQMQTLPLELECQRECCELEVYPYAFQKLAVNFMCESRKTMNQVDNLLHRAKEENFWKGKFLMNAHHIDASKIRLKQQRKLLAEALVSEENDLNKQLAEEESSLSMVQACIDAIERKNAEISSLNDLQYSMKKSQSKGASMNSVRPNIQAQASYREVGEMPHETILGGVYNNINSGSKSQAFQSVYAPDKRFPSISSRPNAPHLMDDNETSGIRCHGCHNYGHFIIDCDDCYKCELCGKHHLNGRPCPAKTKSINAPTSPAAIVSMLTLPEGKCQPLQGQGMGQYQPYDSLHSRRAGRSYGDENQFSGNIATTDSAGVKTLHSRENSLKEVSMSLSNRDQERSTMQQRYPYQVQQESRQVLVGGHVMHTVTRTITEEILESRHESDSKDDRGVTRNRDIMRDQEIDDRPWFQVTKRRKSVIDTVNQENNLNTLESNRDSNNDNIGRMQSGTPFTYRLGDDDQRSRYNNEGHYNALTATKRDVPDVDAASPRQQGSFRSGLQLLIESET